MVDDIRLFASRLPLTSFQVSTSCEASDTIISVIRLDYTALDERWQGKSMYYDIYDATTNQVITPVYTGYNHEGQSASATYGNFSIPQFNSTPSTNKYNNIEI